MTHDLQGRTFGKWGVVAYSHTARGKHYWLCRCACGVGSVCESYTLRAGRSMSCRRCSALSVVARVHITHGQSRSTIYRRWQGMKTRCTNPKAKSWRYHGGAGVRVCDEWMRSFTAFRDYMGEPPTPLHTIDRIDPFGHYEPGNVRWATQHEQMCNTRRSRSRA